MKTAIEMTREYAKTKYFPTTGWFQIDEEPDGINLPGSIDADERTVSEIRITLDWVYSVLMQEPNQESREDVFRQILSGEI